MGVIRTVIGGSLYSEDTEVFIGQVGGLTAVSGTEISRPANTTAYTAGDVVSDNATTTTPIGLQLARIRGGGGYITKVRLVTDQSTCVSVFRVWVYTINTMTVSADNAAMSLLYANKANRLGYIELPAMTTETGAGNDSASAMLDTPRFAFKCASTSKYLYFILQTKTTWTPASGQKFYLEVTAEVN